MSKHEILVSVDIEKAGPYLEQNPVISVGFCVGNTEGEVLEQKRFNIKINWPGEYTSLFHSIINTISNFFYPRNFDEECWTSFWSKLPTNVIEDCKKNAKDEETTWIEIALYLDELENRYPEDTHKIKFLTDNASFDIGNIDYYLEKYTGRKPMRYSESGKYRSIIGSDDMFFMIPERIRKEYSDKIDSQVKHDHNPVNDAHYIYLQYVYAREYANKKSE